MIKELTPILDRATSVSVLLTKQGKPGDDRYTATLVVKVPEGQDPLPSVQITGTADEIDDEVSRAFNEVAETYADTADAIAAFKKQAAANKEAAAEKSAAAAAPKKTAAKKAAAKKAAKKAAAKKKAKQPDPEPKSEPKEKPKHKDAADTPAFDFDADDEDTKKAMAELGL